MTRAHRDVVLELAPRKLHSTFTLSEAAHLVTDCEATSVAELSARRPQLAEHVIVDITDPIGQSAEVFATVGSGIATLCPPYWSCAGRPERSSADHCSAASTFGQLITCRQPPGHTERIHLLSSRNSRMFSTGLAVTMADCCRRFAGAHPTAVKHPRPRRRRRVSVRSARRTGGSGAVGAEQARTAVDHRCGGGDSHCCRPGPLVLHRPLSCRRRTCRFPHAVVEPQKGQADAAPASGSPETPQTSSPCRS